MTRGARQRHLLLWLLLAPLLAAGLIVGLTQRPPQAISEGPIALPSPPDTPAPPETPDAPDTPDTPEPPRE